MRPLILLSALAVLAMTVPSWAQTERYPTSDEIETLVEQMRQGIPDLMETGMYNDSRTLEERQQRAAFVEAWMEVDAMTAPFLGEWFAIEESLAIFPAAAKGEVCIVDTYLDDSKLYFGRIVDDKIYTDLNLVLVLDNGFLGSTFVYDGEAGLYEYANPRVPDDPTASDYFVEQHPDIVRQFQAAGCLTGLPE